ncbi:MAG: FecR domain-containing protein [Burkholderiales bacterium]|nr:FecR domain-containing protein [Burkholderiales bacterium]
MKPLPTPFGRCDSRRSRPRSDRRALRWAAFAACTLAASVFATEMARADDDLPGRVGRVADVAGELFLAPQDQPEQWAQIGVNYPVAEGDNLWLGHAGRAEIDLGASVLRMADGTNLHLSRLDDRRFALFVAQGRVQVRVRVLDPGETARIDTPNAQVVLTRPGSYRVDVSEDRQHTRLAVREGEANVLTLGAVQQVLPGQMADVDGTDPQYADVRNGIGTDGFDAWVANRDRRYQTSRVSSYVSPRMVGAADLGEYGTWTQEPEYGAVWFPTAVAADWAPYRYGYWTEVGSWGPTWVDAAPWGYAPFHYGRWAFIGGRWGWCPGAYVARPLWAPALVAWTGGPGWGLSVSLGRPVYGWVPLGWAEPYRPWWNRCSSGCWDRYNRPYAVNVARVRPTSPPPTHYVNWNAPGGVTAVPGSGLVIRKPVQANRVEVTRTSAGSAPTLAGVPMIRAEPGRIPIRRPGEGNPPPASTFYPTHSRQAVTPASSATMQRSSPTAVAPGTPLNRATTAQPRAATQGAAPSIRGDTRAVAPAAIKTPVAPRQSQAPTPATAVVRPTTRMQPAPTAPSPVVPAVRSAPVPAAAAPPQIRAAPAPAAQAIRPLPAPAAPTTRSLPARSPPAAAPSQQPAAQPAIPPTGDGANVTRRDDRGSSARNPDLNPDRNPQR